MQNALKSSTVLHKFSHFTGLVPQSKLGPPQTPQLFKIEKQ